MSVCIPPHGAPYIYSWDCEAEAPPLGRGEIAESFISSAVGFGGPKISDTEQQPAQYGVYCALTRNHRDYRA